MTIGNNPTDFVQLLGDGTFKVNGVACENTATIAEDVEYTYTISYNGATVSLFQNGEYITGRVLDASLSSASYIALGGSDALSSNKIHGTYKDLVISPTSLDTRDKDDAAIEDYIDNSDIIEDVTNMSAVSANYVQPTIGVNNGNSGNDLVYNYNNTTYYQNILHYEDARNDYKLYTSVGKDNTWSANHKVIFHIYYPTVTVLYDALSDQKPIIPVALGTKGDGGGEAYATQVYITNSDFSMVSNYWYGYSDHISWYGTDSLGDKISASGSFINGWNNAGGHTNTTRSWSNAIIYTGTPTSTLTEIATTSWFCRMDTSSQSDNYDTSGGRNATLTSSSNLSDDWALPIRIIDVTELNQVIDEIKEEGSPYNTIITNHNYYTPQSTLAYLNAVEDITDFDINSYFNNANNYTACANDIDALVYNYDVAVNGLVPQNKVTFNDYNGSEINHYYFESGTRAAIIGEYAPALPANYFDTDYHYIYDWDNDFVDLTADVVYSQTETKLAHSYSYEAQLDGTHIGTCYVDTPLGHTITEDCSYEDMHYPVSGVNNGYTVPKCTACGYEDAANTVYDTTDWSAYTAYLGVIDTNIASTAKYTSASIDAYRDATNAIKATASVGDETKSQAFIDAKLADLMAQASLLHLQSYTITFITNENGTETTDTINAYFGELVELAYTGDGNVYKWISNFTGSEKTINITSPTYGVVVNGDATYTVYASKEITDPVENTSVVTLKNKGGAAADVAYMENGTYDVSISGNTITIGDVTLTAPILFFYDITGFTTGGVAITDSITISGDTSIRPVYTAKPAADMTITYTDCYNAETSVNGGPVPSKWDEKITVTKEGADKDTEWLINGKVVGYGETFTFRMTQTAVVTCRDGEEKAVAAINYMTYDSSRMISKIVASYDLPEGATAENNLVTYELLMNSVGTSAQKYARTQTADSQQFVFDISRKTDISFVTGAIAFVTYELGGNQYTVYSDEVTYMEYTKA